MDIAMKKDHPMEVSSRRSIRYRESSWRVHEFEVWSGERVCCCAALRMPDSLLLWLGGAEPRLAEVALGLPAPGAEGEGKRSARATALLGAGAEEGAQQLARRLAAALARPVYVCCGSSFDRISMPLVERGLVTEIKSWPEY